MAKGVDFIGMTKDKQLLFSQSLVDIFKFYMKRKVKMETEYFTQCFY